MFTHPKKRRLLKRQEFRRLFQARQKFYGKYFSIEYILRKDLTHPRLGITITKQCGKANRRNLFKRRIKEIFRHHAVSIDFGVDLNVRAKPKTDEATFLAMSADFERFLTGLQALAPEKEALVT